MIAIIGAGLAGSFAAKKLAESGFKVKVFEEHSEIGKPLQCTGIVTSYLENLVNLKEDFITNRIKKTRIFSPDGNFVEVKHKKEEIVLDRIKFDKHLAKSAENSGAELYLNNKFLDFEKKRDKTKLKIAKKNRINFHEADILIGADGALSKVAKSAGIFRERKFFIGMQAIADLENDNSVETYLIEKGFAWIVPENKKKARIGIVASYNPNSAFKHFLEKKLGRDYNKKIISRQSGLIPFYNPKQITQKEDIFLVGDAATMTKATTAGGIIQALIGAETLADSIVNKKDYESLWRKRMGKELHLSLIVRNLMDKFKEKDYNYLIKLFGKEKNKRLLESYSREFPSKLLFKLALREPGILKFLKVMFR